jgi:hypothetical protein
MSAPYERRPITFDGKPVMLYVDAPAKLARPFLARCQGATLAAQERGVTEDEYVEVIREAASGMGLVATLTRRDDRELVFDVKARSRA